MDPLKAQDSRRAWTGRTRGGYFGNWLFIRVLRLLGLRAAYLLLVPVSFYFLVFAPKAFKASSDYLRRRFNFGALRRFYHSYLHFFRFGQVLLDRIAVADDPRRFRVAEEGFSYITDAAAAGKGLVLLGAHAGGWEAAMSLLGGKNIKVNVVRFEGEAENIRGLLEKSVKTSNIRVIGVSGSPGDSLALVEALGRGEVVAMHGDRTLGGRTAKLPFLGGKASFPLWPYAVAAAAGAPLIHTFAARAGAYSYSLKAWPPALPVLEKNGAEKEPLKKYAAAFAAHLEEFLAANPLQWFNFYPFWEKEAKKVLLVSANTEVSPYPAYPAALPRLAAALATRGFQVTQYDMLTGSLEELDKKIRSEKPFLIGVSLRNIDNTDSCTQRSYIDGYSALVSAIRAASCAPIVLGGSGFSIFPEELVARLGADYGIAGRGEEALCELADAVALGKATTALGYIYSKKRPARPGAARPPVSLHGAEHEKDMLGYYWREAGMIGVQTKTGCPLNCVYCTYPLIDGRAAYSFKTEAVADEVVRLHKAAGVDYVFFSDSVFNMDRAGEMELAEALIKRGSPVKWGAFFSPRGIDGEYLDALKRSGLTHIEFGSDSFSDPVLEAYGKGFRYADISKAGAEVFKAGIPAAHYLIFGGPGETAATVKETLARTREQKLCVLFAAFGMRVFPGTPLARLAAAETGAGTGAYGLEPAFYFAPGFDSASLEKLVNQEAAGAGNWLLPRDYDRNLKLMGRLRARGKSGPLWEYLCR
ncbi:MAG: hypothetical protein COT18_06580 [Elusimicrobia bacterium CG08_land_8_20_14_0_20_59_10]|nr:MAG: hypothetical protein COT18_06580 [Elusimicrobia bacterium CG08_land_8_20_14_0_20_59_10]